MNEINPKTLLLKKQIIVGDLTFLKIKKGKITSILNNINAKDKINIFNNLDEKYLKNLNNQPWNVFFDICVKKSNKKIGFIWIVINHNIDLDITFHGGGWENSLMKGFYYTDVLVTLINYLKKEFKIIRTSCFKKNIKAKKLIEFVGFKLQDEKDGFYFFVF